MEDALLALPFGLAIGILLGLVGGGGSILAVPVLVYVLDEPVKQATTESLLIVGVTALAGTLAAARDGRVHWRVGVPFAFAGSIGALAGTALNRYVGSRALLFGFGLLLLVAAYVMLRGRQVAAHDDDTETPLRRGVAAAGTATGLLTGFFGVGGGFVIVPALTVALRLPMRLAVGTSLLAIAITSAVAFFAHLASGGIDILLASAFAGAATAGALLGSRLHGRLRERSLRHAFAALLVGVGAVVIADSLN